MCLTPRAELDERALDPASSSKKWLMNSTRNIVHAWSRPWICLSACAAVSELAADPSTPASSIRLLAFAASDVHCGSHSARSNTLESLHLAAAPCHNMRSHWTCAAWRRRHRRDTAAQRGPVAACSWKRPPGAYLANMSVSFGRSSSRTHRFRPRKPATHPWSDSSMSAAGRTRRSAPFRAWPGRTPAALLWVEHKPAQVGIDAAICLSSDRILSSLRAMSFFSRVAFFWLMDTLANAALEPPEDLASLEDDDALPLFDARPPAPPRDHCSSSCCHGAPPDERRAGRPLSLSMPSRAQNKKFGTKTGKRAPRNSKTATIHSINTNRDCIDMLCIFHYKRYFWIYIFLSCVWSPPVSFPSSLVASGQLRHQYLRVCLCFDISQ